MNKMAVPSSPRAQNPLETAVLQPPCEEQLHGALVGDLESSPCADSNYKESTHWLFILPRSSAPLFIELSSVCHFFPRSPQYLFLIYIHTGSKSAPLNNDSVEPREEAKNPMGSNYSFMNFCAVLHHTYFHK